MTVKVLALWDGGDIYLREYHVEADYEAALTRAEQHFGRRPSSLVGFLPFEIWACFPMEEREAVLFKLKHDNVDIEPYRESDP
jgi:hypothetical protein